MGTLFLGRNKERLLESFQLRALPSAGLFYWLLPIKKPALEGAGLVATNDVNKQVESPEGPQRSLDRHLAANLFHNFFDGFGFAFGDAFLDSAGSAFHQGLSFAQAEAGDFADGLKNLDL